MKNLILITLAFLVIPVSTLMSQSFEAMHIQDITTTPSASRSAIFVDVNADGLDDIYFTNGLTTGENNLLYINNGDGTFKTVVDDDIVLDNSRSVGASFADVDNDGDLDAMMVTWGSGGQPKKNFFYRNDEGLFTHESAVAPNLTYSETASWIDINNDQYLDLFITNSTYNLTNLYFENQGDGTFQQITNHEITNESLPSRSVDWVDYNNDGKIDLFITNEGNNTNSLFRNDGNGNFSKITNLAIVQDTRKSMGSAWADVDNDGDFDLVVVNYESGNQLFINDNGIFTEQVDSEIASELVNSFSAVFADVDNDGAVDLFISNSYNDTHFTNSLYLNDGSGNFIKDTISSLSNHQGWTYSAAFGDYDYNGWLDIILANNHDDNQVNALFRNTGSGNNWIKIRCFGTESNHSAIGAVVKVTAVIDGKQVIQTRKIEASSGYCSQNSLTTHFGLGNATNIEEVKIHWPSGAIETYLEFDVNATYTIEEGIGLGFNDDGREIFRVFPNPVQNILQIETRDERFNDLKITIATIEGKIVKEKNDLSFIKNTRLSLDISNLSPAIYLYSLSDNSGIIQTGKLIKE